MRSSPSDRGYGPQVWIRICSHDRILLGPGTTPGPGQGYYRRVEDALRHVDAESLVEVIPLPSCPRQEPAVSDLDAARLWATEITTHAELTGWSPEDISARAVEIGELCGVTLDLDHPDTDLAQCVVASHAGWVVGFDAEIGSWIAR